MKAVAQMSPAVLVTAQELIETGDGWSPYLSLDDVNKLDDIRDALRRGDVKAASRLGRVFTLARASA